MAANRFYELLVELAQGRSRVDQEMLWRGLQAIHPEISITTSARSKVRELVDEMVRRGLAEQPRGYEGWDHSSAPALPKWIRLRRQPRQRARRNHRDIPWAPELRFLSTARVDLDFDDLLKFQRFFAEGGRGLPIVPIKERSLHVFGDEKRLDALYSGSTLFATGRLTLDQLRCVLVPEPLGWKRGPAPEGPIIVLENVATWDTFCRWNEVIKCFSAVVYGGGNRFADSVVFLQEIGREIGGVRQILYFGDLDVAGLSIPQRASRRAVQVGLPAVQAHIVSYKWLLEMGNAVASSDADALPDRESCNWLGDLAEAAWTVLALRKRISQERIGWEFLRERSAPQRHSCLR